MTCMHDKWSSLQLNVNPNCCKDIKLISNCCTNFETRTLFQFLHVSLSRVFPPPSPLPYSASKSPHGSSWVAASLSFPLMHLSHSAVACPIRAERTPGSLPEAFARRSPPLPAHLSDPLRMEHHCPGCYLMAPLHRQTKLRGYPPPSPASSLHLNWQFFFFLFCLMYYLLLIVVLWTSIQNK